MYSKMATLSRCFLLFFYISCVTIVSADDIERVARKGVVLKLLKEMANKTQGTLELPANATSIRENITDTFSCENRTYGYYADVDNECQVFHVCLTSQRSKGRNVTYRWSFICPNETIFNQEVLTCTRPRDSIPCEESPKFYYLNDEIGKVPNDTENAEAKPGENTSNNNKTQRRKPIKKQNLIVENLMDEVRKENLMAEMDEELAPVFEENIDEVPELEVLNKPGNKDSIMEPIDEEIMIKSDREEMINREDNVKIPVQAFKSSEKRNKRPIQEKLVEMKPASHKVRKPTNKGVLAKPNYEEYLEKEPVIHEVNGAYTMKGKRMENARLSAERTLKRKGRKISRGSFRFMADRY